MKSGPEMMRHLIDKILEDELPYRDSVVIGDNSSGKTMLLKLLVENVKGNSPVYFIDAVNRGFDVKKISRTDRKPEYKKTILETRLQEAYFNLVDSFNCFGTLTERIEIIYRLYEKEVQELFYELTNDRFQVIYDNPIGEVDFGNGQGLLSSGYQAIIRILLELLYYQEMEIEKNSLHSAWLVIDELDEYLSPRYCAAIMNFLRKKFPWGRWIITTHSCNLVANTNDSNAEILLQPMGIRGSDSKEMLALQYNVMKMEFEPAENRHTYSDSELRFIKAHIKRFHLNDPEFRSRQLFDFVRNVIDHNGKMPEYEYNNLTVMLFCEKLKGKPPEEILKICKNIFMIAFLKM